MALNKARKTDDFIKVIDKVLSPDLCREIIDIFDKSANVQLGRTGGETEFYYQDVKISPRTGRMVIAPAGFTHTRRHSVI